MRVIGLDVGHKIIGVAVSDPTGLVAQGAGRILRSSKRQVLEELKAIVDGNMAECMVIGLPKNMDGTIGGAARDVMRFCEEIQERLSIPVVTWDERLSTVAAEKTMLEADLSRAKRKRKLDELAAVLILQSYLDYLNRSESLNSTGGIGEGQAGLD